MSGFDQARRVFENVQEVVATRCQMADAFQKTWPNTEDWSLGLTGRPLCQLQWGMRDYDERNREIFCDFWVPGQSRVTISCYAPDDTWEIKLKGVTEYQQVCGLSDTELKLYNDDYNRYTERALLTPEMALQALNTLVRYFATFRRPASPEAV